MSIFGKSVVGRPDDTPEVANEPTPDFDRTVRDQGFDPRTLTHLPTRRGAGGRFTKNPNYRKETER